MPRRLLELVLTLIGLTPKASPPKQAEGPQVGSATTADLQLDTQTDLQLPAALVLAGSVEVTDVEWDHTLARFTMSLDADGTVAIVWFDKWV